MNIMKDLMEGQCQSLERAIRICLHKSEKKGGQQHMNPEDLATLLTMSYLGLMGKAIGCDSIHNIEENERAIDDMVESIFASSKNRVS